MEAAAKGGGTVTHRRRLVAAGLVVLMVAAAAALVLLPSGRAAAATLDDDGDGRSIDLAWSGADLTVTGHSLVSTDSHVDISIQADVGEGFEEFGGGASYALEEGGFNPTTNKCCLSTYGLSSDESVRVVATYYDAEGDPTDSESYLLSIP